MTLVGRRRRGVGDLHYDPGGKEARGRWPELWPRWEVGGRGGVRWPALWPPGGRGGRGGGSRRDGGRGGGGGGGEVDLQSFWRAVRCMRSTASGPQSATLLSLPIAMFIAMRTLLICPGKPRTSTLLYSDQILHTSSNLDSDSQATVLAHLVSSHCWLTSIQPLVKHVWLLLL